jgi:hypothetical protein
MAIDADVSCAGTFELVGRSITIGDGTDYAFDGTTSGLGNPEVRDNDVDKGHGDGAITQHDFYQKRVITIPISIAPAPGETATKATIWGRWLTLKAAWAKSFDVDLELVHDEVGFSVSYFGRPTAVTLDDSLWRRGLPVLRVLLAFRCGDPAEY